MSPEDRRDAILSSRHNAPVPAERERYDPVRGSINASVRGAPVARCTMHDAMSAEAELEMADPECRWHRRASFSNLNDDRQLRIVDGWRSREPLGMRIVWRFGPDWLAEERALRLEADGEPCTLFLRCDDAEITVRCAASVPAAIRILRTDFSPDYGAREECWAIEIVTDAARDARTALALLLP